MSAGNELRLSAIPYWTLALFGGRHALLSYTPLVLATQTPGGLTHFESKSSSKRALKERDH